MFVKFSMYLVLIILLNTAFGMSSGNAESQEREYGNARGWQILATSQGRRFLYCGAVTSDNDQGMAEIQITYDGRNWRLGRNDMTVKQYFGRIFAGNLQDNLDFASGPSYWIEAFLHPDMVREIRAANSLIVEDHTGFRSTYSLSGSTAALLKVEECARNKGRKRGQKSARPTLRNNAVRQAPTRRSAQPAPRSSQVWANLKRQQAQKTQSNKQVWANLKRQMAQSAQSKKPVSKAPKRKSAGIVARKHIQNYWKRDQYLNVESGRIASTRIQPNWWSAQWYLEPVQGQFFMYRLKNIYTSQYLHNQNGRLEMGHIKPGWHSAQWNLLFAKIDKNVFNLRNRWTKQYLHIEHGYLELGNINQGWHSAGWLVNTLK